MRLFISLLLIASFLNPLAAQLDFSQRSIPDIALFPFFHGVASGDPLPDRVILWTRLTTDDPGPSYAVNWRVATDTSLSNVVSSGTAFTDASRDFTVKVDASGLNPNSWYYYEFEYEGRRSLIGRTRTAPSAFVDSLRFAVVSCSNYQAGFFNAYARIGERNDIDAVIHLGDYIYEYESGGFGFDVAIGRDHDPDNEIVTLSDYRLRHSWYKLDDDSRYVHQHYPFIAIYDDHEFANDAWKDGAENHQPATEGPWGLRKNAALQAWMEWMPVREVDPLDPTRAYRSLPFGGMLELIVIDTRIAGRDEQNLFATNDPSRSLLGTAQYDWLVHRLTQSAAQWKVLVNQVMFSPLEILGVPVNSDQWDGYLAEKNRLLDTMRNAGVQNFVVLTGDLHTAFSSEIPTAFGNAGVEFVTTSVTSPGFPFSVSASLLQFFNPHVRYANLTEHGYLLMDFNSVRTQGDHVFVGTVNTPDSSQYVADSRQVVAGTLGLIPAPGPSVRPGPGPARPPAAPVNSCAIPSNTMTTSIGSNTVTIQWDATPGAVGYFVQGRLVGAPSLKSFITGSTSNTFNVFESATTYEWRVAASCDAVNVSPFSPFNSFTTSSGPLRMGRAASTQTELSISPISTSPPRIIGLYPMPFRERFGVHFQLEFQTRVQMEWYNATGRLSHEVDLGTIAAGIYFREINGLESLLPGSYVFRIVTGESSTKRNVLKVH